MIFQTEVELAQYPGLEKMSAQHHGCNPHYTAQQIVKNKSGTVHFYNARYDGSKGADDGKEFGKKDRCLSIVVIKISGAHQVFFPE